MALVFLSLEIWPLSTCYAHIKELAELATSTQLIGKFDIWKIWKTPLLLSQYPRTLYNRKAGEQGDEKNNNFKVLHFSKRQRNMDLTLCKIPSSEKREQGNLNLT